MCRDQSNEEAFMIGTQRMRLEVFVVFALLFLPALPASGADEGDDAFRERFTARAVAMGTSNPPVIPSGSTATLDINITRWTTDEERLALLTTLLEHGQEGLTAALRKQPETGWVRSTGPTARGRTTTFPSERLRYARQLVNEDGSRRIVLALDRPISLYEGVNRPRWRTHDITMLFIDVDAKGKGSGQLAIGVRLDADAATGMLSIENFGTEPVRLTRVRQER
jgi:hypothetical protein